MPLRLAILRITARPPSSARDRATACGPASVGMPLTLAFPLPLALLFHVSGQICQAETRIPLVPLVYWHIMQKWERDMPVSAFLLLSWAVTSIAAPLVAQLLLAAKAINVPHHAVGYLNYTGARFLKSNQLAKSYGNWSQMATTCIRFYGTVNITTHK